MDRIQKQSILLVIETLEGQLQALRALIGLTDTGLEKRAPGSGGEREAGYTNEEDDKLIEEALKIEEEKDQILQNIFAQASENQDLEG